MSQLAVLMCACNAERFIGEAITSILKQTYQDFEFIIIENGSSDRTFDIIQSFGDPRIKAFQSPLKRLTFNLNYGLLQTKAKYVARMDADDISMPERLELQMKYLIEHPETTVLGTAIELFGDDISSKTIILPTTDNEIRRKLPFIFSICHPSVIFQREAILKCGGYEGKYAQDLFLWLKLSKFKTVKFANLSEPLLKYRIHHDQIKGLKNAYISVATGLLKEALSESSFKYLCASIFMFIKMIFRASKAGIIR